MTDTDKCLRLAIIDEMRKTTTRLFELKEVGQRVLTLSERMELNDVAVALSDTADTLADNTKVV